MQADTTPKKANRFSMAGLAERFLAELLVLGALLGWWLMSLGMPDYIFPAPLAVAKKTLQLFTDPQFMDDTALSALRVILSVVAAVILGTLLALMVDWWPATKAIVHERIKPFLNSFPSIGWAIMAVIWFGQSNLTVMFVQVMILTPFCLINVSEGLRDLDRELLEMGRSFTRNPVKQFLKITLPLLMPYIMAAVRIGYGVAWKISLVAELFGAESGLGYVMLRAQTVADGALVFASCFAIVIVFMLGEKFIINPLSRMFQHK